MFEKFYTWAERQLGLKIQALQSDNALEFKKLGRRLEELGIHHRFSASHSHQQMGHAERRHKHLVDTTITMLNHAQLPASMWDFGVLTSCYLYNQNPTRILQGKSPLEALF